MYVIDFLRSRGVWFEALLHRPASSSTERARSVHTPGRRVAKAVVVRVGDSFVLAVLPSTSRIDLVVLSALVSEPAAHVRLATPEEVFALFPNCEPGVVPPFGRLYGLKTLVDPGLADSPEIIVVANTRHEGFRMRFRDFQALEEPVRASFARPLAADLEARKSIVRDRNRRAG